MTRSLVSDRTVPEEKTEELYRLRNTFDLIRCECGPMLSSSRRGSESSGRLESRLVLLGLLSDISIENVCPIDRQSSINKKCENSVAFPRRIENDVLPEVRPIASGKSEGAPANGEPVGGVANRPYVRAQGYCLFVLGGVLRVDMIHKNRCGEEKRQKLEVEQNTY